MSSGGPTIPTDNSSPGTLSTAPAFAITRRGSTPVILWPKTRSGSRRHSILMFRLIVYQSDFGNLNCQKGRFNDQVADVKASDIDRRLPAPEKIAPERQVSLDAFI